MPALRRPHTPLPLSRLRERVARDAIASRERALRGNEMKSAPTPNYTLWQNFLLLAGRVLMGWIFVEPGLRKLRGMDAFIASLTNRRVPYARLVLLETPQDFACHECAF